REPATAAARPGGGRGAGRRAAERQAEGRGRHRARRFQVGRARAASRRMTSLIGGRLRGIVCFVLVLGACSSSGRDSGGADLAHGGSLDGGMAARDLASNDFAPSTNDFAPSANDFAPSANDLSPASSDLSSAPSDLGKPPADMTPSRPPCTHGPGFAAFRFHYSQSSGTQAILDAFGLPDNSNWEAVPVYPTSYTDTNFGGGIELGSGNWILIRYSVA